MDINYIIETVMSLIDIFTSASIKVNSAGILDEIYGIVTSGFLDPMYLKLSKVMRIVGGIFQFVWLIFITFYGYLILAGKIQAPAKDFVFRMTIITIIFFVALDQGRYQKYIAGPVYQVTHITTKVLTPSSNSFLQDFINSTFSTNFKNDSDGLHKSNRGLFIGLDINVEATSIILMAVINTYQQTIGIVDEAKDDTTDPKLLAKAERSSFMNVMLVMGFVGLIITGVVMIYVTAAVIMLLNHMLVVILLLVGPLFVVLSVFKATREYAKKWASRLAAAVLTLALASAVITFILASQSHITSQMCEATVALQSAMIKDAEGKLKALKSNKTIPPEMADVKVQVKSALDKLDVKIKTIYQSGFSSYFNALTVVSKIQAGCEKGAVKAETEQFSLVFAAIQFLIFCMVLNRVLVEVSNVAATLVNASGINANTQEVSSGLQGVSGRVSRGGR